MHTTKRPASPPDHTSAHPRRYTPAQTLPGPIWPPSAAGKNTDVRTAELPSHSEVVDTPDWDCTVEIVTCSLFAPSLFKNQESSHTRSLALGSLRLQH